MLKKIILVLLVVVAGFYIYKSVSLDETSSGSSKLKADTFTGVLEEVNTGCFADAEWQGFKR